MLRRSSLLLAVSLALAGCGGSSGSSALPQAVANAPAAAAPPAAAPGTASQHLTLEFADANLRGGQSGWGGFSASLLLMAPTTVSGTVYLPGTAPASQGARQVEKHADSAVPAVGAVIVARNADTGNIAAWTLSGADGSFHLVLPAGHFVVTTYLVR